MLFSKQKAKENHQIIITLTQSQSFSPQCLVLQLVKFLVKQKALDSSKLNLQAKVPTLKALSQNKVSSLTKNIKQQIQKFWYLSKSYKKIHDLLRIRRASCFLEIRSIQQNNGKKVQKFERSLEKQPQKNILYIKFQQIKQHQFIAHIQISWVKIGINIVFSSKSKFRRINFIKNIDKQYRELYLIARNRHNINKQYSYSLTTDHYNTMKSHQPFFSFPCLIFIINLYEMVGAASVAPTWITSNYVRAGNEDVITTLTGKTKTPTHTFTFSSALSGTPHLAYGMKAYEGADYLWEEKFQVNRTYLDSTKFSVAVQIMDTTNIWHMNVPYIAIDPQFPHDMISFDNVPINYSAGNLVNITKDTAATQTYTNTINFASQASSQGSSFTSFASPYSRNKILLFITSAFIQGKAQGLFTKYPVSITTTATVVSSSQYTFNAIVKTNCKVDRLHYSVLIFDELDVESTGLYRIEFQAVEFTDSGGFLAVPVQFVNNFIMALIGFTTEKTGSIIDFQILVVLSTVLFVVPFVVLFIVLLVVLFVVLLGGGVVPLQFAQTVHETQLDPLKQYY